MELSKYYHYLGGSIVGAIAAVVAERPGFNARAVKVLGAGGMTGIAVTAIYSKVVKRILEPLLCTLFNYELDEDTSHPIRAYTALYGLTALTSLASMEAGAALMNYNGIPISYKTAALVASLAAVGCVGGIFTRNQGW